MTEFVREAIFVLGKELEDGYLTQRQFNDYIALFRHATDRVLSGHPKFQKEVDNMTKPMIILPSVRERVLEEQLADKDAEIDRLRKAEALLANKDAEIDRLRKLLAQQG